MIQALASKLSADIGTSWRRSKQLAGCPPYVAGAGSNKSVGLSNCARLDCDHRQEGRGDTDAVRMI